MMLMMMVMISGIRFHWPHDSGARVRIEIHEQAHWLLLGNGELNGMTFALAISAWGGVYTFVVRFVKTRKGLID